MGGNESIEVWLARRAEEVNAFLDTLVPAESVRPGTIHKAMRYSLFAGGKRLRPSLVLAAGEALGAPARALLPAACAVEMIHTYSLIHDDLPAMDDDDLRRGRPTSHKVFGEAVAILAGDALLTRAFEVLSSEQAAGDPARRLRMLQEVAGAAGTVDGIIGGQVVDLESEGKPVEAETLSYIHRAKTGALLRACVVVGGIAAGGSDEQIERLRGYGEKIGLAFQIADDLLDLTSTAEQLGKTPGKDEKAKKATWPALYGIDASRAKARALVGEAAAAVAGLGTGDGSRILAALADFVVSRAY